MDGRNAKIATSWRLSPETQAVDVDRKAAAHPLANLFLTVILHFKILLGITEPSRPDEVHLFHLPVLIDKLKPLEEHAC